MSGQVIAGIGLASTLLALAWGCYWASRYHFAKAEVYQEFADTFRDMAAWSWAKDKDKKKAEQKRAWMRLTLCDPICAAALRDALDDADHYWRGSALASGDES